MDEFEDLLNKQLLALQQSLSLHHSTMRLMRERKLSKDAREPAVTPSPQKVGSSSPSENPSRLSQEGGNISRQEAQKARCQDWLAAKNPERNNAGSPVESFLSMMNSTGARDSSAARPPVPFHASTPPPAGNPRTDLQVPLLANIAGANGLEASLEATPHCRKQKVYNHAFNKQSEVAKRVQQLLLKGAPSAEDCYYTDKGLCQKLARSPIFQNGAMFVIILNCIWLAIDTDYDHAPDISDALPIFQIVDNFFCSVFSFEIAVRFFAFKKKRNVFKFKSFLFDAALVSMMAWETWLMPVVSYFMGSSSPCGQAQRAATILRIVRVFRLMRAARMARLLKNIPELMIMAKGMLAAMRATATILSLLAIVIYIFAIAFTQLLAGAEIAEGRLDEVLQSMHFLLMCVLCGADATFLTDLLQAGFFHYLLFIIFLFVAQLTIMNMLIGILCQIVTDTAQSEKEQAEREDLEEMIRKVAVKVDTDGGGSIDKAEFEEAMKDEEITCSLAEMGVDLVSVSDYATFIFNECGQLSYSDFSHMLSQFLGTRVVTLKDIMDLRKYLVIEMSIASTDLERDLVEVEKGIEDTMLAKQGSEGFVEA